MNTKPVQIGCYIDGSYQTSDAGCARVVRLSEELGRVLDRDTKNFCLRQELDCPRAEEWADEFSGEAEDWLNENVNVPYAWWGWNEGSFGLWPMEIDSIRDEIGFVSVKSLGIARRLGIETDPDDPAFPPADYEGEWLHVNDHGNGTLYVRTNGQDTEIWSVV